MGEELYKLWYINTMEYDSVIKRNKLLHATTWRDLKKAMLSEEKQIPQSRNLYDYDFVIKMTKLCRDGKQISGCQSLGTGRGVIIQGWV